MAAEFLPIETNRPGKQEPDAYRVIRPGGVGIAVAEFPRPGLIHLVDYPELPLRSRGCETIKIGGTSLVVKTDFPLAAGRVSVAYKRIRRKNLWKVVTGAFRRSRASRAWRVGRILQNRGIATPRPIAVVLPRKLDIRGDAFLATEWVEGSSPLPEFLRRIQFFDGEVRRGKLAVAAASLGRLLGRMHAAGVRHRDLKPSNLLIVESAGGLEAMLTDLDGASVGRRVPRRIRHRNLSRLLIGLADEPVVSRSLQLRGLESYMHSFGPGDDGWKPVWSELQTVASARAARRTRRAA